MYSLTAYWYQFSSVQLIIHQLFNELSVLHLSPALDQLDGGRGQKPVWQQVNFLHDVGQTDRKLLTKEDKRRALTGIDGTCRMHSVITMLFTKLN